MPQNAGRCALPALLVFSLLPNWQQQGAKVFSGGNTSLRVAHAVPRLSLTFEWIALH